MCQRLATSIEKHEDRGKAYMVSHLAVDDAQLPPVVEPMREWEDLGEEQDDEDNANGEGNGRLPPQPQPIVDLDEDVELPAYKIPIAMPSGLSADEIVRRGLQDILQSELELRQGQAEDRLTDLRLLLAWRSVLYKKGLREATTYRMRNRSWAEIRNLGRTAKVAIKSYEQARQVLLKHTEPFSDEGKAIREKYLPITKEDVRISTEVISFDISGNRNASQSWIWSIDAAKNKEDNEWLQECEFFRSF